MGSLAQGACPSLQEAQPQGLAPGRSSLPQEQRGEHRFSTEAALVLVEAADASLTRAAFLLVSPPGEEGFAVEAARF